jgi:GntR family transcriptional regulator, transcriptional repressor for pyruvate dehydrogenase complex
MGDPKPSARSSSRVGVPAAVFEQLLGSIVSGEWKEGQRILPERELCQQLGVARPSLREALKALEIMGLVDSRVGAGTFVRKRADFLSRPLLWAIAGSSSAGARELVESRLVLEGELAGFAADRATESDLLEIRRALHNLDAAPGEVLDCDLKFHLAIAFAAHNQVLLNAVLMIRNLIQQWMLVTLQIPGIIEKALIQHTGILESIVAKDSKSARDRMRGHLSEMGGLLVQIKSPEPSNEASHPDVSLSNAH